MKNLIILINMCVVLLVMSIATVRDDSTARVAEANSVTHVSLTGSVSGTIFPLSIVSAEENAFKRGNFIEEFVFDISEARLMDREEGRLAEQRATFRALKDYGALMVKDQTNMLKDLSLLATRKKLTVATVLGEQKTDGLSDLHQLHGKTFDKKFIKMMIIDHKRDIKKLEKATTSKDADIQVFATKYLPVVQNHLAKIQAISESI
jgi:putative membrane protein